MKLTMKPWPFILAIGGLLLAGSPARADDWVPPSAPEYLPTTECLEWIVANSELVIRGGIVSESREGIITHIMTVSAVETLKGSAQGNVQFRVWSEQSSGMAQGTEVLACLVKADDMGYPSSWKLNSMRGDQAKALLNLSDTSTVKGIGMDGRRLVHREEILQAGRSGVALVGVWKDIAYGRIVPINEQMEAMGREWLDSDHISTRLCAVSILGQFKSPQNIDLMKSLLEDVKSYEIEVYPPTKVQPIHNLPWLSFDSSDYPEVRYYPVRARAYDVLQGWGITVPAPQIRERVRNYWNLLGPTAVLLSLLALIAFVWYLQVKKRRRLAARIKPTQPVSGQP